MMHSARKDDDRGVAIIEFSALVPLIVILTLLVWQVILIGLTSMFASHAAAEGARQAAVTPYDIEKIESMAKKRISEPWNSDDALSIDSHERSRGTYVQASIKTPVLFPGWNSSWKIQAETRVVIEDTVG